MKKFFKKHLKNEKGLTLIELLAVIVILGIIAAIAVPAIGGIISNSKDSAKLATAANILAGAKLAATDNSCTDTSGAIECSQEQLTPFVENVKGEATYSASRTKEGVWTVKYSGLNDFNSKKYEGLKDVSGQITEPALNNALEGNTATGQ